MRRLVALAAMVVLISYWVSSAPASASIGTGVGSVPLTTASAVKAGSTGLLTPLYIINTGSETATYSITVLPVGKQPQEALPASWVKVAQYKVTLKPGAHVSVPVQVHVPKTAAKGNYGTSLLVSATGRLGNGTTSIAAAAAAQIRLSVSPPASKADIPWLWIGVGIGLMAVITVLWVALRRRRKPELVDDDQPQTQPETAGTGS